MNPTQLAALLASLPGGTDVSITIHFVTPTTTLTTSSGTTVPFSLP